jgi:hypothetical protein
MMPESSKDRKRRSVSRRQALKQIATTAVALPFVLAIPSNAPNVITTNERRLPFREREEEFFNELRDKLAQIPHPPPPAPPPPAPKPSTLNTAYDTSINTPHVTSTFSGNPPKADDTKTETYHDGTKTDYKTDTF